MIIHVLNREQGEFLQLLARLMSINPNRSMYLMLKDAVKFHAPGMAHNINQEQLWTNSFITECIKAYLNVHGGGH
jgi:hypothetical protein